MLMCALLIRFYGLTGRSIRSGISDLKERENVPYICLPRYFSGSHSEVTTFPLFNSLLSCPKQKNINVAHPRYIIMVIESTRQAC